MIQEIEKLDLRALSNDAHFSFHQAGLAVFTAIETENELFKGYLKAWQEAFCRQDNQMYLLRRSLELEKAHELHKVRRNCLASLLTTIRGHAICPHSAHYELANTAYAHLSHFRQKGNASVDKVSSAIHHIAEYLEKEEVYPLLMALGLQEVFEEMKAANEAVIAAQALRDELESKKVKGGVQQARKETDAAYAMFVKCLMSMMILFPGVVEKSVTKWNATVRRYRKNLELKQAIAVANRETDGQDVPPISPQGEGSKANENLLPSEQDDASAVALDAPAADAPLAPAARVSREEDTSIQQERQKEIVSAIDDPAQLADEPFYAPALLSYDLPKQRAANE